MTESNVEDRRFWVVLSIKSKSIVAFEEGDRFVFDNEKDAATSAKKAIEDSGLSEVYVAEVTSKHFMPEPTYTRQNLHIPPAELRRNE